MSKERTENINGIAPQSNAVEHEILERLRREKEEFDSEAYEWGKEQAREYIPDASYLELKEIVERSGMPENWDDIRDGARDMGYDEGEVIKGFQKEIKDCYDRI